MFAAQDSAQPAERSPQASASEESGASAPSTGGRLVYAVGDVHGELELFRGLLADIVMDVMERSPQQKPMLVLLGDYIDRGAGSAGVLDLLVTLKASPALEVRALMGNHEATLLDFLEEPQVGPSWGQFGGLATLRSYGVTPPAWSEGSEGWRKARDQLLNALPGSHLALLRSLETAVTVGDYLFVHAGVRPGVPLSEQSSHDLMWIRNDFLSETKAFEKVVVHGHTPAKAPQVLANRLGIDTGAYATGVLTAVRLEDRSQAILQARVTAPDA